MRNDGTILLSGYGTLISYDTHRRKVTTLPQEITEAVTQNGGVVNAIATMENGETLIATDRNGVMLYRPANNSVMKQSDNQFPYEIPDGFISVFYYDTHKNLWMGMADKGIEAEYYYEERFNYNRSINRAIGNNSVSAVEVDNDGILWALVPKKGIYAITLNPANVRQVDVVGMNEGDKSQGFFHLLIDREGAFWLSTGSWVFKCNYNGTALNVINRFPVSGCMDIRQAADGTVWIANFTNTLHYVPLSGNVAEPRQVVNNYTFIPSLLPLKDGNMLIASFNQHLLRINTANKQVE